MLLWRKAIEIQIFSFAGFASIRQVPTVLALPGRRVANAFGGFAIDTTFEHSGSTWRVVTGNLCPSSRCYPRDNQSPSRVSLIEWFRKILRGSNDSIVTVSQSLSLEADFCCAMNKILVGFSSRAIIPDSRSS